MHHLIISNWFLNLRLVFFFFLTFFLIKKIKKKFSRDARLMNFAEQLPGPYAYPIIGSSFSFLFGARDGLGTLLCHYSNTYGSTVAFWVGKTLTVLLSEIEDVETVLHNSNCLNKSIKSTFHELLGNSLVAAEPVAVWKQKRKELQPFFARENLYSCIPEMNELIYKYIEKIKKKVDGPEFDVGDLMNDLSLDTITKTHFNFVINDQEKERLRICQNLSQALTRVALLWFFPWRFLRILLNIISPLDVPKLKGTVSDLIEKNTKLNREFPQIEETEEDGNSKSSTNRAK